MNTLIGLLATYNDIKFPRYRFVFKLRKLQTTFIFHQLDLRVLQDILCSTGIQALPREHKITETQLSAVISEIFAALRSSLEGHVNAETIEEAHTTCFNWLLTACMTSDTNATTGTVGVLKIFLILFSGSKTEDKAKYLFEILATDGTVGLDGLQFFCEAIELLANSTQESVYPDVQSTEQLTQAMSDFLSYMYEQTEAKEEESKAWLSAFDFVKIFTTSPPLKFLSWLDLWTTLPIVEKVIHPVKCKICNKKRFRGFRYQCEDCVNYHMCQMCFLKGRTSHNHHKEHKVVECQDYTMTLRTRLGLSHSTSKVYRIMDEPQDMHVQVRLTSQDLTNGAGFLDYPLQLYRTPSDYGLRSVGSSNFDQTIHRVSYVSTGSSDIDYSGHSLDRRSTIPTSADLLHGREGPLQPTFFSLPRQHRYSQKDVGHHDHPIPSLDSGVGLVNTDSLDEISKALDHEIDEIDEQFMEISKRLSQNVDQLEQDMELLGDETTATNTDEESKEITS